MTDNRARLVGPDCAMPDAVRMWGVWSNPTKRFIVSFSDQETAERKRDEFNGYGNGAYRVIPGTFTPDAEADDEQE